MMIIIIINVRTVKNSIGVDDYVKASTLFLVLFLCL